MFQMMEESVYMYVSEFTPSEGKKTIYDSKWKIRF